MVRLCQVEVWISVDDTCTVEKQQIVDKNMILFGKEYVVAQITRRNRSK